MGFIVMPRYQMRKHALKKLLLENMKKSARGRREYRLLEIGYGAGEIFSFYKKLGLHAEGYDFSGEAYAYAMQHYQDSEAVLHKEKPKAEKQFDYVVASEVLEHIEDDVSVLKEWKKYLKKKGKMIISVPAHQKRWGMNDVYAGHCRRYERRELIRKFSKAGLHVEKIYTYDFPACLLLDGMRDKSREQKMARENLKKSREEFTKTSGLERNFHPVIAVLASPWLWFPIIKMEELFYKTDFGSAYILSASLK